MIDIFKSGDKLVLEDILDNKEARTNHKIKLLQDYPHQTLIAVAFNMPGDIKNNKYITAGFTKMITAFQQFLTTNNLKISFHEQFDKKTGPEAYFLIDAAGTAIKQLCIAYEELNPSCRLLDIDVYQLIENKFTIIDRGSLQQAPRLCYLCGKPAKECTRNQTHAIEELRAKINEIFQDIL
jgi:holo-ACP synthase CitX